MRRLFVLTVLLVAAIGVSSGQAAAATRWVNDDKTAVPPGTSCDRPGYNSIEDAENVSAPGDTINVCPGTYPEVVTVDPGRDGLTIRSVFPLAAVIQAPPTIAVDLVNFKSIVRVTTSKNVTLAGFTITGPGPAGCDSIRYGVRVDGGGSANIVGNHITDIRDNPFGGCQNGIGIQVGRQIEAQTGSAKIALNYLDDYQKGGIVVDNAGSTATIDSNVTQGAGPTPITAQNGIQISRGAVATATGNGVFDHTYSLANLGVFSATGILLYQAGDGTVVDRNVAARNDDNLGAYTTLNSRVSRNRFTDSTFYDGIYMGADTANNQIVGNYLRRNAEHDCHDDSVGPYNFPALVANPWINNDGVTQNKVGLCKPQGRDDDHDHGHHGHGHSESD
jgi:hypothetical protein